MFFASPANLSISQSRNVKSAFFTSLKKNSTKSATIKEAKVDEHEAITEVAANWPADLRPKPPSSEVEIRFRIYALNMPTIYLSKDIAQLLPRFP